MSLKDNINKIHSDLENFEKVSIVEKSSLEYGNYIELSITESKKEVVAIIKKVDLENNTFNWLYKSDPTCNESFLVPRTSKTSEFSSDVKDIFDKNRFDSEYIESINK